MSEGTISGRPLVLENGRYWPIPQDGSEVWVWEPLLTPISDDDPDAVTEPVEQEVEA